MAPNGNRAVEGGGEKCSLRMEMCSEIIILKRQPSSESAKALLTKVYRYVLPIMRKHKLKVKAISEFFPKNANLLGLNINHGQKIAIRLRHAHNPRSFLLFEDLLGTMLHELAHNKYGPHNEAFFRYLDELKGEMQALLSRGFKGDQWIGDGKSLGTRRAASAPAASAGVSAAHAARRAALNRHATGHKLGGTQQKPLQIINLREKLLNAAERRRMSDKVCPADHPEVIDLTEDSEVIDLTHLSQVNSPQVNSPDDSPPVIDLTD